MLTYTPEAQARREEIRAWLKDNLPPKWFDKDHEMTPAERKEFNASWPDKLFAGGWICATWPKEYGGKGLSTLEGVVLAEEFANAGAPMRADFFGDTLVGPTLLQWGTEEQKQEFLPKILSGKMSWCQGFSEPNSGSDLASVKTSAVLDGDEWIINGNKVYTSGANQADYIWLACRTDPDAPKHKGISIIIVPTASLGFSWTPIVTVGDVMTTATYYSDVRVPKNNVVGEINGGWKLITAQLNHERVGLAALSGLTARLVEDVTDWAKVTKSGGINNEMMIDLPWVQMDIAKSHALLDATRLMTWKLVKAVSDNTLGPAEASVVKVFGTEKAVEVYRILQGILGPTAHVKEGSQGAMLHGEVERAARAAQINTFGGGVNEVGRQLVASAGLGLVLSAR